jgi:prophage DNA circulation protein
MGLPRRRFGVVPKTAFFVPNTIMSALKKIRSVMKKNRVPRTPGVSAELSILPQYSETIGSVTKKIFFGVETIFSVMEMVVSVSKTIISIAMTIAGEPKNIASVTHRIVAVAEMIFFKPATMRIVNSPVAEVNGKAILCEIDTRPARLKLFRRAI